MRPINKLHVYTGEGKGKTTAAMGLALRGLGHGNAVLVAQFMKKGNSGELIALKRFESAVVMAATPIEGFTFQMDDTQRARARECQSAFLEDVFISIEREKPKLIVLDELGIALTSGMVTEAAARAMGLEQGVPVVQTGNTAN